MGLLRNLGRTRGALAGLLLATLAQPAASQTQTPDSSRVASYSVLADGRVGRPYGPIRIVSGGKPPYLTQGSSPLPTGLTLSPDGDLAGVPQAAGQFEVTFVLTDSASPPQRMHVAFLLKVAPR